MDQLDDDRGDRPVQLLLHRRGAHRGVPLRRRADPAGAREDPGALLHGPTPAQPPDRLAPVRGNDGGAARRQERRPRPGGSDASPATGSRRAWPAGAAARHLARARPGRQGHPTGGEVTPGSPGAVPRAAASLPPQVRRGVGADGPAARRGRQRRSDVQAPAREAARHQRVVRAREGLAALEAPGRRGVRGPHGRPRHGGVAGADDALPPPAVLARRLRGDPAGRDRGHPDPRLEVHLPPARRDHVRPLQLAQPEGGSTRWSPAPTGSSTPSPGRAASTSSPPGRPCSAGCRAGTGCSSSRRASAAARAT